ncbi:MAG: nucleotidyltransferase family protein [Paludibacteraceae bacterium]
MKAMIFAAGLGTRLYPITENLPKALVSVGNKPLLEHTILKLKKSGFDEIIINVHHFADQIIRFLKEKNNFDIRIEISDEREQLLDTGGGIKKVADFFNDNKPFLIHNVDILSNVNLNDVYIDHLQDTKRLTTLVVSYRDTYRYLLFDEQKRLRGWINTRTNQTKPTLNLDFSDCEKFAYAGIQVVSPKIFQLMESENDVFPVMDFYLQRCVSERIIGFVPKSLNILDVGKIGSLEKAETFLTHSSE